MAGRPNIVIIMTDQQRAELCAREGFSLDTTPSVWGGRLPHSTCWQESFARR
jgi:hypothetical protein